MKDEPVGRGSGILPQPQKRRRRSSWWQMEPTECSPARAELWKPTSQMQRLKEQSRCTDPWFPGKGSRGGECGTWKEKRNHWQGPSWRSDKAFLGCAPVFVDGTGALGVDDAFLGGVSPLPT